MTNHKKVLAKPNCITKLLTFNTNQNKTMYRKLLSIAFLVVSAFAFTACSSSSSTMTPAETNVLGIIKHEPASYDHTDADTFALHTDELFTRKNYSGDKTTLLWGLVTIKDY